jgi:hypothetical protein
MNKFDDFPEEAQKWIQRLHTHLWDFVRIAQPGAGGSLDSFLHESKIILKERSRLFGIEAGPLSIDPVKLESRDE